MVTGYSEADLPTNSIMPTLSFFFVLALDYGVVRGWNDALWRWATFIHAVRMMNSRVAFVICSPLLTIAGAATTVIAPMLLDAPSFVYFALLNSVFTYLSEFDLGLARTADRLLPGQSAEAAMATGAMLLSARYCLALALLIGVLFVADPLMLVAGIGGIAMLLGNGPLSLHLARGNTASFAVAALLMQFGLTLPRLIGLLLDGVRGAFLGMMLWSGIACVVLNVRVIATAHAHLVALPKLFARSIPLFLYNAAWLAYLFANRWISWWVSGSATDAGLFAFGANLTMVAIGIVIAWSQPISAISGERRSIWPSA